MDLETDDPQERALYELHVINSKLEWWKNTVSGVLWGLAIGFAFSLCPGSALDRWTDKIWYSLKHNVSIRDVTVEKRPFGCDWLHAPVGDKGCRYKKSDNTYSVDHRNLVYVSWEKEAD